MQTKLISLARKPLFKFFLIALIFSLPIMAAWILSNHSHYVTRNTLNYGTLVKPPRSLKRLTVYDTQQKKVNWGAYRGQWILLYVHPLSTCMRDCERHVLDMRQIRLATGKHMDHLVRAVLTFDKKGLPMLAKTIRRRYPGTLLLRTNKAQFAQFISALPSAKIALKEGYFYLVDGAGNIMMSYRLSEHRTHIFKDIKRLVF